MLQWFYMSEIEDNQPMNHSTEANPPSKAEVESASQKIVDHLDDAGLESARWMAFADYADRDEAFVLSHGDKERKDIRLGLIDETIRQRKNEIKGYKNEDGLLETIVKNYRVAIHEYVTKKYSYRENLRKTDMDKYREYTKNDPFPQTDSYGVSARGLLRIKEHEIDKRSR